MSKCSVNDNGKHLFYATVAPSINEAVSTYHTCIGCGERRALTQTGELIIFNVKSDLWEKLVK